MSWFSPGTPVSSVNKADRYDITEILLNVALNIITSLIDCCSSFYNSFDNYSDEQNLSLKL